MFTLLIKGTIADVETALSARGFHRADWLSQPRIAVLTEQHTACTIDVRDETEPGVTRWFAETPGVPPFPVGTLLHFRSH